MRIPKTIGACADALYTIRSKRLDLQKKVDALAAEESELREHIICELPKSDASGVAGKLARVSVVRKQVPSVKDWDTFYRYVKRTGAFELLHRRVADAAIRERWDAGKTVPGVEVFTAVTVSLSKA